MNCQEFWNTMPELRSGSGGAESNHLRECPACARRLEGQRALAEGLRAVAAEAGHVGAPPRTEARLLESFRRQNGVEIWPRARIWAPALAWAVAAAALVVMALWLVRGRQVQPQPAQRKAPHRIELAVLPVPNEMATADDPESGFIPLPNAAQIEPNEDVNLVRVELPRASMIALGYSVSAERAAETVEAEVVLGTDGLARAVRFLNE